GPGLRFWEQPRAPKPPSTKLGLGLDPAIVRGQPVDVGGGEICAAGCGEGCGEGCVPGSVTGRRNLAVAALLLAAGGTAAVIAVSQDDDAAAPASP
ncbi:MAG: hypothetical protein ACK5MS_20495, partial [Planctomyces sp.]